MAAGTTVDTTVDVEDDVEINSGSSTENQEEERQREEKKRKEEKPKEKEGRHKEILHLYRCEVCGKNYKRNEYLEKHKAECIVEFPCEDCGEVFQSAQELKEHIKVAHKGVGSLGGLVEMAQNVEKLQVKERIEKVSAGLSEGIKCDMCELYCGDERGLTLHRKACAVMNPYSCNQCGERFCNRPKLNVHMDAHENWCLRSLPQGRQEMALNWSKGRGLR